MVLTVHDKRKDRLLKILNHMWSKVISLKYDEFNVDLVPLHDGAFEQLEKLYPELICKIHGGEWTTSTIGMMATITEVMCGDRLAMIVNSNGVITGFTWHSKCKDYPKTVPFKGNPIGGTKLGSINSTGKERDEQ